LGARASGGEGGEERILGLTGIATDLGEKQVDAEGGVLVVEVLLELGNLLAEHVGGVADTADDTETASVGDGSSQLGASGHVHAGQQDGVLDLEKIGDGRADLLCKGVSPVPPARVTPRRAERLRGEGSEEPGGDVRGEAILTVVCGGLLRQKVGEKVRVRIAGKDTRGVGSSEEEERERFPRELARFEGERVL